MPGNCSFQTPSCLQLSADDTNLVADSSWKPATGERKLGYTNRFPVGRLAQRESTWFTPRWSQVQILYRPPIKSMVYRQSNVKTRAFR